MAARCCEPALEPVYALRPGWTVPLCTLAPAWANALQSVTISGLSAGFSMTLAAYLARLEVLGTRASRTIRAVPSHDRVVVVLDGTLSA